jgi:hypothetical protein
MIRRISALLKSDHTPFVCSRQLDRGCAALLHYVLQHTYIDITVDACPSIFNAKYKNSKMHSLQLTSNVDVN